MDAPWLHGYERPSPCPYLSGYVVERDGWYWTGVRETPWSRNPRRALVDALAPWDFVGKLPTAEGRCVQVLLENEATMLPLRHWPRLGDGHLAPLG